MKGIRTFRRLITWKAVFLIAAVAALGGLAVFLARVPFDWAHLIRSLEPTYLLPAYLAYSLALLAAAVGWHYIVDALASQHSYRRNVHIYVTTAFARRLPGSLWGLALRTYWYKRFSSDWRLVGLSSVVEVWAAVCAGTILALIAAVTYFQRDLALSAWSLLILLAILVAATGHPRVRRRALDCSLKLVRVPLANLDTLETGRLIRLYLCESATWLFGGLELVFLLRAMAPYPLGDIPKILACWVIAGIAGTLITFLPGGFALVELTLTALLSTLFPLPVALAAALLLRLFTTLSELTWMAFGMAALWLSQKRNRAVADQSLLSRPLPDILSSR